MSIIALKSDNNRVRYRRMSPDLSQKNKPRVAAIFSDQVKEIN